MIYILSTQIGGKDIAVACDEDAARVLLPIWSKAEPNLTCCRDMRGTCIVSFGGPPSLSDREYLESFGYVIGYRDPRLNMDFPGKYMVAEPYEASQLPTRDACNGPWCIVGDDLDALISHAADTLRYMQESE
jgi:hypothetical protein